MPRKSDEALRELEQGSEFGVTRGDVVGDGSGLLLKAGDLASPEQELEILIGLIHQIDQTLATIKFEIDGEAMTIDEAQKRKEELRGKLKEAMGKQQRERVIDEISGQAATVSPSFSESWDLPKLKEALKPAQRKLVVVETIDHGALGTLIETGAVSRAALEVAGAVTKKLRSVALRIRPFKEDR